MRPRAGEKMRPLADGRLDHVDNVAEAGEPISKRNKTGRPRSHGERWWHAQRVVALCARVREAEHRRDGVCTGLVQHITTH